MQANGIAPRFEVASDANTFIALLKNASKMNTPYAAAAIGILQEALPLVDRLVSDGVISREEFGLFYDIYGPRQAQFEDKLNRRGVQDARDWLFYEFSTRVDAAVALEQAKQVYTTRPTFPGCAIW